MERLFVFLAVIAGLVIAELIWPRRDLRATRAVRWPSAAGLLAISAVMARFILPAGLAGLALWAEVSRFGLFNLLEAPIWLEALVCLIVLDFAVWAQHVVLHQFDWLWRWHRVHHSDPEFDVTTALRFHPGEIILSLVWKGAIVVALGVPAYIALLFEILLSAGALFSHSNLAIPSKIDRWLRWIIVTPDMHRVHHSTDSVESNRNFGFFLPWWDRLFRLYKAAPQQGHELMQIGQDGWRQAKDQGIVRLLIQPFQRP